jgi:cytochrome c oxidase subunit I+III
MGWDGLNLLETVGAFILAFGILLFIVNLFRSWASGEPAGDNPWNASGLEWATSSPPEPYNFRVIPTVTSREPLWDQKQIFLQESDPTNPYLSQTLSTTALQANPDAILKMPGATLVPFLLGISLLVFFVGLLLNLAWLITVGVIVTAVMITAWLWPEHLESAKP